MNTLSAETIISAKAYHLDYKYRYGRIYRQPWRWCKDRVHAQVRYHKGIIYIECYGSPVLCESIKEALESQDFEVQIVNKADEPFLYPETPNY